MPKLNTETTVLWAHAIDMTDARKAAQMDDLTARLRHLVYESGIDPGTKIIIETRLAECD